MTALLPPPTQDVAPLSLATTPTRTPSSKRSFVWPLATNTYTPESAFRAYEAVRQVFLATNAQCAVDGLKIIGSHEAWRIAFGMTTRLPSLYDFMVKSGRRMQGADSYRTEVRRNLGMMVRDSAHVQADLSRVRFGINNCHHLVVDSGPNYAAADELIAIAEDVFAGVGRFFRDTPTSAKPLGNPHGFIFLHALKANMAALGEWEQLAEDADMALAGDEEQALAQLRT